MPPSRFLLAVLLMVFSLVSWPAAAEASPDFRQQYDLKSFTPPAWFLEGHFVAREVGPRYLFGSVADFVKSLNCPTAWLIEKEEEQRQERLGKEGKNFEYTVYLEAASPAGTVYWVFVVLPHKNAQEWFDERWSYHKSKAKAYYGQTQSGLERALAEGLTVSGELRFLVEAGQPSLRIPEEVLTQGAKFPAKFDLQEGKRL